MAQEEDTSFTFSDEDFERRYGAGDAPPTTGASRSGTQSAKPLAVRLARSRNRYMRTLLRRRLAASART